VAGQEPDERLDRELIELLNELRVALPGVQVLFAFLLTLPFTQRFEKLAGRDKAVFFTALLATLIASALLIAPSAHHRLRFRERDKEHLIRTANRLALWGMGFVAVAMACSVFVIAEFVYGGVVGTIVAVGTALLFGLFWYAIPLRRELGG
jgi:high-affinity Fe2+/Pb2+ permease